MSETLAYDEEFDQEIDKEELQRRAYNAVESATGWLIDRRRTADAESRQPYSDKFTTLAAGEEESGFMSSAEGMTALFQVIQYTESEDTTVYFSPQIDADILTYDVEWILDKIDETGYPATPYLPEDATVNFTDAVSFTTTTLQEALTTEKVTVDDERIEEALEGILEWLLDNYIESPSDDHDGVGWAWCGATEMDEMKYDYPPQTYFTYSGTIALTDLYLSDHIDTPDEEVADVLSRAIKCLVADYWVQGMENNGWTEFTARPYGQDLLPNSYNDSLSRVMPDPFPTCNTLMILAYMWNRLPDEIWEGANLTEEEMQRIPEGIDFALNRINERIVEETLHEYNTEYTVEATVDDEQGERQVGYFDGTLPYTAMNALSEIAEADGPFEHRAEGVEDTKLQTIRYILDKCWDSTAGDIGFSHIDPKRDETPAVMYATQIAIESLLAFELKPPEEGVKVQVMEKLENTQAEIAKLLDNQSIDSSTAESESSAVNESRILGASEEFTRTLMNARKEMESGFDDVYEEFDGHLKKNVKDEARRKADDDLPIELQEVLVEEFLHTLTECYYATDPEEFRDALENYRYRHWILVWEPQREAIETLESLADEKIETFDQRTEAVSGIVDDFRDDLLNGHDPEAIADNFNDRDF